jgi:CBS domain-containing protein
MLTVREVMTAELLTLAPQMTLRDAVEALTARHVSGAPVIEGGVVIGTISACDILAFEATLPGVPTEDVRGEELLPETEDWEDEGNPTAAYFTELWDDAGAELTQRFDAVDGPEWDTLAEHTVLEAMSADVRSVPSTACVTLAAENIQRTGVHRVLVIDEGDLVGIVTTMDITRAVAMRQLIT